MTTPAALRVAIDLETTGLQSENESIIEIGAVKFRGDEILDTFETFITPHRPIPYRIQRLTHITPAMLVDAPAMAGIAPKLRQFLSDLPLVGHNVGFDAAFLRRQQIAQANPLLDTFELASILLPDLTNYTLEQVAATLGFSAPIHHRALADAQLSREVFLALEARVRDLPDPLLNTLCALAPGAKLAMLGFLRREQQARGIQPTGGAAASSSLGAAFQNQLQVNPAILGTRLSALSPPLPSVLAAGSAPPSPATMDTLALATPIHTALEERQTLVAQIPPQPEQVDMVLRPALEWAIATGQRLVIATASAAGARALAQTHLPRVLASLAPAEPLTQALLFEPRDYLCTHRWYGPAREAPSLAADTLRGLAKLSVWIQTTETGSRDSLNLGPTEQVAWEIVHASDTALELPQCTYRDRGWCFPRRARTAAETARIVITTQAALLGANRGSRGQEPTYVPTADGYLILDAQLLEDRLLAQASWTLDQETLLGDLDMLFTRDGQHMRGLLALAAETVPGARLETWGQQVTRATSAITDFIAALGALATEAHNDDQAAEAAGPLRLDSNARTLAAWGPVGDAWSALERRVTMLADTLAQLVKDLRRTPSAGSLGLELHSAAQRLRQIMRYGRESVAQPRAGWVYWIRTSQANGHRGRNGQVSSNDGASLSGAPAQLSRDTGAAIQGLGGGVVIAGTALAVDGRFDVAIERLGLPATTPTALVSADFTAQSLVLIPTDVPEPNAPAYQRTLNEAIVEVAAALDGNTVVLLASHTALRTTYSAIKPLLEAQDIMILAQGIDGSLRQLWQNYRTQSRVVILGAGNMWEGWESDGARPRCLFVARLPLPAMNEPLLAARAELYSDAMQQFVVPQAAIRLRLALNRMAWEHDRRNVIIIYDRRIQTKTYGTSILHTLPLVTVRDESVTMLGNTARGWIASTATTDEQP